MPDVNERAQRRLAAEAVTEQVNLEDIAGRASKYLPETVSEEEVDADWRTSFFKHARNISEETMREVWAQILAGEVTKPGTFSLRTLEALRLMSKAEAETFGWRVRKRLGGETAGGGSVSADTRICRVS